MDGSPIIPLGGGGRRIRPLGINGGTLRDHKTQRESGGMAIVKAKSLLREFQQLRNPTLSEKQTWAINHKDRIEEVLRSLSSSDNLRNRIELEFGLFLL